jgi:predicted dehydrogenase
MKTQDSSPIHTSRREFIKTTGRLAAASALTGVVLPPVHAAGTEVIQLALVGCGGRGTGAASDALNTRLGPTRLVAMADVLPERLSQSVEGLRQGKAAQMAVPAERQFLGFDAYRKAMDCLQPGDVVILATPPAFRWVHFRYAIEKGLHVFMEKPVTVDGPTSKRMLELAQAAQAKQLKVGVGLMSRHSRAMMELHQRIQDGEIGDIITLRGYRMQGSIGHFASTAVPAGQNELMYQIQRFHSFLWAGGGAFSDFNIHVIDHLCWMKNAWPVKAQGLGGRHYRHAPDGKLFVDQNFDSYSIEYTFEDGTKLFFDGRCVDGAQPLFASYVHGSKGMAIASKSGDCGQPSMIFKGHRMQRANMTWQSDVAPDQASPYQNEWNDLMAAIRNNTPFNEAQRGVEASLVTALGRMAAHTGQEISYEDMLNCSHEFAPGLDQLKDGSAAPLVADASGAYPLPEPGRKTDREY